MGKSLVLAEKPSVGREIAKILGCRQNGEGYMAGDRYIVTWALGHLVTLADPEHYDKNLKTWSLESLPMLPPKMQLVIIKKTGKQFSVVAGLLKRADISEIIIATDAGREGELVARWILMKAGCHKPLKRLWISSQTERAVRDGFKALKPARDYDNLFQSAEARAEADWLVGLNVSRALTCKHNASLSAGRVQTPTLAMIVAREQEIKSFVPKDFYTIKARFDGFAALWMENNQSRLFDRSKAEAVKQRVAGLSGMVTDVSRQPKSQSPPAAYDLTELQRDANRKYGYSAKQTLDIMQSLYERHKLLTYPRTDSRYITDDIVPSLPDRLKSVAIGPYREVALRLGRSRPLSTRYLVNNSKVNDHHAIIPTDEPVKLMNLSSEERHVYDLVVRRFLAVLSPVFEYEETRVTVTVGSERFYAKGKTVVAPGWKLAYESEDRSGDEDEDEGEWGVAGGHGGVPPLHKGDKLVLRSCDIESGKTKPPARYTEATLLTAMESPADMKVSDEIRAILKTTSGLGTPATRADIIEKLFASFYVERHGKEIVPTSKGIQLMSLVPDDLRSAALTGRWEQELALISRGKSQKAVFVKEMRGFASKLVAAVAASDVKYVHDNLTREKCPECGKFLLEVNSSKKSGQKGVLRICPDRECGFRKSVAVSTNARCPQCHKKMELRGEGEKRTFFCVCGHRERMESFEKRRAGEGGGGASKSEVQKYLKDQDRKDKSGGESALALQLARWKEKN
ncbi:MAG: DNA topoisomerase III [Peptococcaceae bacterium]|nr:DNA topoisomerase III [Peptococcaceae bacterium]